MGWRDRLEESVRRTSSEGFEHLRALFKDDDQLTIERFLLALVRSVRDDETEEERSARDVYEIARKRRRRLAVVAFGAGPLVGVANQVADLYCDTATVCDLAEHHDLELTDEQVGGHMLVLWDVTESVDEAEAAIRQETVAVLLADRLREHTSAQITPDMPKRKIVKVLWDARDVVGDVSKGSRKGAFKTVAFTGRNTKDLIERAEEQLGIRRDEAG